ncbi:hypothetical protein KR093_011483 [Drosophila rubida]|uniref:Essential protein Yae1 N-terminal domain-containing protein n=1 Tax=Drosophila rubida TaxID=30044 RepID=A0AAD4PQA4_9MUSC|nr:hypothetical protein KR093_011483 [Drosophila rubida]
MSHANSSDDETDFKAVNTTNYERVQQKVAKISYADGIADGREKVFQNSFDLGYADGLRTGLELAKLQTFYDTLTPEEMNKELTKECESYNEMELQKATDKSHFKYLEHQTESLSVVSEKQKAYLDDLLHRCAKDLPITTSLLQNQIR